jgi:hypothetical protein
MNTSSQLKDKKAKHAERTRIFRMKWEKRGLCAFCKDHNPIFKSLRCPSCYEQSLKLSSKSREKIHAQTKAKLSERKTVHEWLTAAGIPSEERGKPLCLLRRLRITVERYRKLAGLPFSSTEGSL